MALSSVRSQRRASPLEEVVLEAVALGCGHILRAESEYEGRDWGARCRPALGCQVPTRPRRGRRRALAGRPGCLAATSRLQVADGHPGRQGAGVGRAARGRPTALTSVLYRESLGGSASWLFQSSLGAAPGAATADIGAGRAGGAGYRRLGGLAGPGAGLWLLVEGAGRAGEGGWGLERQRLAVGERVGVLVDCARSETVWMRGLRSANCAVPRPAAGLQPLGTRHAPHESRAPTRRRSPTKRTIRPAIAHSRGAESLSCPRGAAPRAGRAGLRRLGPRPRRQATCPAKCRQSGCPLHLSSPAPICLSAQDAAAA